MQNKQCKECNLYNSLGCPYAGSDWKENEKCDEFRPLEKDNKNDKDLRTMRVTFTDGTVYSCHIRDYWTCCYENIPYLFVEEWYADGHRREVNIAFDKIQMFMIE